MARARGACRILALACLATLALAGKKGGDSDKKGDATAATADDLPLLGQGGAPVLTVDGRVCAFPWVAPDGPKHDACAALSTSADDKRLWCKDASELWGICAAPKAKKANKKNATDPSVATTASVTPGASLPLFPGSSQASALSVADSGEAGFAPAPAALTVPAATLEEPAAELVPKPAEPVAPKPLPKPVVPKAPAPPPTLGPLRDSRGPATLTQQALDVVARLRVQLAAADAERLAATDEASKAVAVAKARYIRQQLSAVQGGFIDASSLALPAGSPAGPVCAARAMQCGGLEPGSNTVLWKGPSECCGANGTMTCVQTDPAFATCVPVEESRAKGCSALNARCGGDFWSGPFCCAAGQGCMWQSQALSTCKLCPKLYEQCGGNDPTTGQKWARATCCPGGSYCKQLNAGYSQCKPNGS